MPVRISFGEAWLGFGDMLRTGDGSFGKDLRVQRQKGLEELAVWHSFYIGFLLASYQTIRKQGKET